MVRQSQSPEPQKSARLVLLRDPIKGGNQQTLTLMQGTILTKATEYIHQLERRNRSMAHKNEELLRRLQAFEQLLGASAAPTWQPQGYGAAVFNPAGRFSS